ncbi:hypothetical protein FXO37_30613 [Capsicum annuum]|nr:hypothetical protein FXO37_30613 [Capsicum annuum]
MNDVVNSDVFQEIPPISITHRGKGKIGVSVSPSKRNQKQKQMSSGASLSIKSTTKVVSNAASSNTSSFLVNKTVTKSTLNRKIVEEQIQSPYSFEPPVTDAEVKRTIPTDDLNIRNQKVDALESYDFIKKLSVDEKGETPAMNVHCVPGSSKCSKECIETLGSTWEEHTLPLKVEKSRENHPRAGGSEKLNEKFRNTSIYRIPSVNFAVHSVDNRLVLLSAFSLQKLIECLGLQSPFCRQRNCYAVSRMDIL